MFGFTRTIKCAAAVFVAAAMLIVATLPSQADTGAVRFRVGSAGFIIGVGGGSGTLTFRGKTYPLRIGGVSIGMIGVSSTDLVGRARNLRRASDIAGNIHSSGCGPCHCRRRGDCPAAECEWRCARGARHQGRIFGVDRPQRTANIDAVDRPHSSPLERESIGSVTFSAPARLCRGRCH